MRLNNVNFFKCTNKLLLQLLRLIEGNYADSNFRNTLVGPRSDTTGFFCIYNITVSTYRIVCVYHKHTNS